jgi:hypothetical protein
MPCPLRIKRPLQYCPVLLQHCNYCMLGFPTTGQDVVAIEVFRQPSVGWNSMILYIVKLPDSLAP